MSSLDLDSHFPLHLFLPANYVWTDGKNLGKNRQNCARAQNCLLQRMVMNCIRGVHTSILRTTVIESREHHSPQKNVTFDPGTCEMWSNRDADGFRLESSGWAQFFLYQILWLGWWRKQLMDEKILLGSQRVVFTCWKCLKNIVNNGFKCLQPQYGKNAFADGGMAGLSELLIWQSCGGRCTTVLNILKSDRF